MDRLSILQETLEVWRKYKKLSRQMGYNPNHIDFNEKIRNVKARIQTLKDSINENVN